MRQLLFTIACALFVAGPAHSQDDYTPICFSGKKATVVTEAAQWHTTLGAGTSQPKLWQVGYLNALPAFDVIWQPLMQFGVPASLAKREIVGVDLVVKAKAVEGSDVDASVYLFGPDGLGNPSKMTAAELVQIAGQSAPFESAYFFEGNTAAPYVFFVDELADKLTTAIARREKSLSIFLTPFWTGASVASDQARISSAALRIYHCPLEK